MAHPALEPYTWYFDRGVPWHQDAPPWCRATRSLSLAEVRLRDSTCLGRRSMVALCLGTFVVDERSFLQSLSHRGGFALPRYSHVLTARYRVAISRHDLRIDRTLY